MNTSVPTATRSALPEAMTAMMAMAPPMTSTSVNAASKVSIAHLG